MKCFSCRYNTLCYAGRLFDAHRTTWCPECGRLQILKLIKVPEAKKPLKTFEVFFCEQRTAEKIAVLGRKTGLNVNAGEFGKITSVDDPGPPQIIEGTNHSYDLPIRKCALCSSDKHDRGWPLEFLDNQATTGDS
jgi:hypothetical protein